MLKIKKKISKMEASISQAEGAGDLPQIRLEKDKLENGECQYHFFVDGQESSVVLKKSDNHNKPGDHTYHFSFYDWVFAEADVHYSQDRTCIEWQGLSDGLVDLAKVQAEKLLAEADGFLLVAVRQDFPETLAIEDAYGKQL